MTRVGAYYCNKLFDQSIMIWRVGHGGDVMVGEREGNELGAEGLWGYLVCKREMK